MQTDRAIRVSSADDTIDEYRLLVESVTDYAIFRLDPLGYVASWNKGARRIKGYEAGEIIGQHFSTFYPPEDSAKPAFELSRAVEFGRYEDEGWRVRKDGSRFWASVTITALRDAKGQLVGFGKVTRDLSDRKRAEEAERELAIEKAARAYSEAAEARLRESEERYRELNERLEVILEGVADGITVQDQTGRLVYANSAAARVCGFESAAEFVNASVEQRLERFEILDAEGNALNPSELPGRRVLTGTTSTASALLHVRECASQRNWWSWVRASSVRRADGSLFAINIWHDVTQQHREREALSFLSRASAALFSSLDYERTLQTMADTMVPEFADWCTVELQDDSELRQVAVAHVDPEKVRIGRDLSRLARPQPHETHGIWKVIRTGQSELFPRISDELLVAAARSERHLTSLRELGMTSAMIVPVCGREKIFGTLAFVYADSRRTYDEHDLRIAEELGRRAGTAIEQALLYAAAQKAARRAEEASRIKDEFLATVSHELRTPLNAILGWTTILQERVNDPSLEKAINVIARNARAQVKIVEDVLDVSRIISGKLRLELKNVDVRSILLGTVDSMRPSAQAKSLEIDVQTPTEPVQALADSERLYQVLSNLLANAIKFTDAGGKIGMRLEEQGDNVVFVVTDNGKGIAPEFLPQLFERFRQADSSTTRHHGGLGLGLALSRHIIELHGGHIRAQSAGLGTGATFTVTIPLYAAPTSRVISDQAAPSKSAKMPGKLQGIRVLVVEDEPDARELLHSVLEAHGAVVRAAASVAQALTDLPAFSPEVLVSDIGMPGEDGYSLMRRIRALPESEGGKVRAVALTAYTSDDDKARALAAGFDMHVAKPVRLEQLVSIVLGFAQH